MTRPRAALRGFSMVDIILALVALDQERARGVADRRTRVRGHGRGALIVHCRGVALFDIVRSKEGMRGRRSPNVGTGLVSCSGL